MMKMLTRLLTLCCRPHVSTAMMTTLPSNVKTISGTRVEMRWTTSGDHAWPRVIHLPGTSTLILHSIDSAHIGTFQGFEHT